MGATCEEGWEGPRVIGQLLDRPLGSPVSKGSWRQFEVSLAVVSEFHISLHYFLRGGHGEDTVRPKEKKGKEDAAGGKERQTEVVL